ncbi:hypothetical protein MNEG_12823, partial [Monoraphidium neglectum]
MLRSSALAALLVLLLSPRPASADGAAGASASPTARYFDLVDINHDGELQAEELASHIRSLDVSQDAAAAAAPPPGPAPPAQPSTPSAASDGGDAASDGSGDDAGPEYRTRAQVARAVQQAISAVDGADAGTTISMAELELHLADVHR